MSLRSRAPDIVADANVFIAICAKEAKTYPVALAQMRLLVQAGCAIYAPGVMFAETLYILCRKLENGIMTPVQHSHAIQRFRHGVRGVLPPPHGDASLAIRAEEI